MNKNELGFKEIFEKENGSHSLTIAPRQTLLPTQTIVINQNLFKYLSDEMDFPPPASIDNSTRHNGCCIKFEKIASIKQLGPQHVYDLRIGFIEKLGTGFDRMKNFCKKSNSPDFNLDVDQKYFRIEFFKSGDYLRLAEQAKAVEKTVEKILAIIKEKPRITQKELSEETGLSRRGIEWNLQKLRNEGIIKRIGPDKGGYWEIIK